MSKLKQDYDKRSEAAESEQNRTEHFQRHSPQMVRFVCRTSVLRESTFCRKCQNQYLKQAVLFLFY